jgi:hypothetical protein
VGHHFRGAPGDADFTNARSSRNEDALQRSGTLLEPVPGLPLPPNAAKDYGHISNELYRRGTPIGANDQSPFWTRGVSRLILVINNGREFERVNEVKVENCTNECVAVNRAVIVLLIGSLGKRVAVAIGRYE